jgi:hypothetical protein
MVFFIFYFLFFIYVFLIITLFHQVYVIKYKKQIILIFLYILLIINVTFCYFMLKIIHY